MRVLMVAGARPNFMKIAPVMRALSAAGHDATLVHTGQHYDTDLSESFFHDLEIPAPNYHLGVGSGSHAVQTGRCMELFEPVLLKETPDWVVVPGDVNSTLACALVTAKLRSATGSRLAHLEAGLRSGNWAMPEEINRVLTDRLSDLLLTPSEDAIEHLRREGICEKKVAFVGNVMIDTLLHELTKARQLNMTQKLNLAEGNYIVATLHRPSNVDDADTLRVCLEAFGQINNIMPVLLPLHPRTKKKVDEFGLSELAAQLHVLNPLGYTQLLSLMDKAAAVLTDSGGLQEETTALGVPCVTLRAETERPVTVSQGTNRLAPWPLTVAGLVRATHSALQDQRSGVGERAPTGWDGRASERVVQALVMN